MQSLTLSKTALEKEIGFAVIKARTDAGLTSRLEHVDPIVDQALARYGFVRPPAHHHYIWRLCRDHWIERIGEGEYRAIREVALAA